MKLRRKKNRATRTNLETNHHPYCWNYYRSRWSTKPALSRQAQDQKLPVAQLVANWLSERLNQQAILAPAPNNGGEHKPEPAPANDENIPTTNHEPPFQKQKNSKGRSGATVGMHRGPGSSKLQTDAALY